MRKFFSLIAAVLFAGSMMATTVSKTVEALASEKSWENAAVVTPFNLDDVISVATEATDANTGKYYTNGQQIRLYQTGAAQLVISAAEGHAINSITLTYASQNTGILVEAESGVPVTFDNVQSATFTVGNSGGATNGQARITAFEVVYDEEGGVTPPSADTYTVAGAPESIFGSYWDPTDTNNDMVRGDDGLYYWEKKVYLTAGTTVEFKIVKNHSWNVASYPESNVTTTVEEDGEYMFPIAFQPANQQVFASLEKVEAPAGPTNCAEAAEAALSVSANNELYNDGAVYTIEGYVTAIQTAFNPTYNNITFWMADTQDGGQVLEAYRAACESEEDAPNVGDKVAVTGSLTKYNNTPEFAAACTYVILERAEVVEPQNLGEKTIAEFLALKNITDTCILTGVVDSIINATYGNLYMSDATAQLYIYGLLTPEGEARHFEDLNVEVGDTLTVKAIYNEYQGNPQAKNAIFVEVRKASAPVVEGPSNCAEAAEAALSVSENNELYNDGAVYTIEGYVTAIQTAFNPTYNNITFWMADTQDGGQVLEAYRAACESEEDAPNVGDKVAVTGSLTKYNSTPEFAAACTYVILERAEVVEPQNLGEKTIAEFLALKNITDTCILTGVVDSIMNTVYGNLYMSDATAQLYIYGLLTPEGEARHFEDLNVEVGDTLTVKAIYNEYQGNPQAKNAIFVEVRKASAPVVEGPSNCAEAAAAALSVSANNELYNDGAVYTIEGYVTAIQTAFNPTYNNITFWMADTQDGGQVLEAYRAVCESEEDAPNVGDKVAVTGSLTKYNNTPEFAAACTYVILERAEVVEPQNLGEKTIAEFLALKNITDTCILTGVVDSIINATYGNLYMSDATAQLYIYGLLTPEGQTREFASLDVEVGDTLTVKAIYNEYQGNPQAKNAIFVEVRKASAPVVEGPSNCAEAAEAALSVSENNELYNNGAVYTIEGYVTAIKTAYSDQYHNISFWMADSVDGGEVLQAYRAACASEADAPAVGDKVAVTGSLTKYNNIPEFAAACTFVIIERAAPVAGDTIVIDIESNVDYVDRVAAQGWWQFMVETDEYEISLSNISTTQAAGVYTMDEMDDDYTYINVKATGTEVTFVDGSLTLTEGEDGSRTIEGVVTGSDGNIYVIKLVYHIPTAETTVNVEIPEWGIVDGSDYYGVTSYIFYGEAADGTYVQLTILGSNPIGQFTYEDCYAGGTGIQVDGDYKSIYSMDINVSVSDAQRAIITADILCVNNTLYHVTTPYGTGFDSVEAAVKAVKKLIDGNVVIEKAGIRYSINGQVIR